MEQIPFLGFSLYQMYLIFCFWSFIGWGVEVCYTTLETGEYQNRGFLNMPICPIYGFGVLMVVIFFRPISHTIIPLFFTSGILCTVFELAVGLGMEKLFHSRWWDYTNEKFNYKGYICLKNSILWGLACTFVVRIVEPLVEWGTKELPVIVGLIFLAIMSILIIIDVIVSVLTVINLNNRLKQIDEISKLLLKNSVMIGENLSAETLELKAKYDKLLSNLDKASKRILKAFPNIKSVTYSEAMEKVKAKLNNKTINKIKEKISKKNSDK